MTFGLNRLVAFTVIFVLLSGAGTYVIYAEFAAYNVSFDARLLSWPLLTGVTALLMTYFTADGLRLHYTLLALGHRLTPGQVVKLVFINIFFSNVTPMAAGGGFAQIWYLRRTGVALGTAAAATTVRTLLAVIVIFTAAPIVVYTMDLARGDALIGRLAPYLAAFGVIYLGIFMVVLFRAGWLIVPVDGLLVAAHRSRLIGNDRRRRWHFAARRESLRLSRGFRNYCQGAPRLVAMSIASTIIFLVALFSFPALLLWGLDYAVDYADVLARLVTTTFFMYFSPTPGASVVAEGVFGKFFAGLVTPGHLVVVTLAWRFLTIYLGMVVGIVVMQLELAENGNGHDSRQGPGSDAS